MMRNKGKVNVNEVIHVRESEMHIDMWYSMDICNCRVTISFLSVHMNHFLNLRPFQ